MANHLNDTGKVAAVHPMTQHRAAPALVEALERLSAAVNNIGRADVDGKMTELRHALTQAETALRQAKGEEA